MSVTGLPRSLSGKVQQAAPGEEKETLALWSGNGREAGEPALAGTAGRWQDKCHPLPVQRDEAWLLRRHEGTIWPGNMLQSEEGVWAEGRPFLCLWSQVESISLATCPEGRRGLATKLPALNSQKHLLEEGAIRRRLPPGCGSIGGGRGCPRETGTVTHYSPSQGTGGVQ